MKYQWLVIDMDEGLLRREPSRAAVVKWCRDWYGPVKERHCYKPGAYGYSFGDRERSHFLFIEREDEAKVGAGRNVVNDRPKYPFPDCPYDQEL